MTEGTRSNPRGAMRLFCYVAVLLCLGLPGDIAAQRDAGGEDAGGEDAVGLHDRGREALEREDAVRAVELFRDALDINPSYPDALRGMAEAYYALEEYDEALEYAERYERGARDVAAARNLLARIHIGLGNLDRASRLYGGVLDDHPNNLEARLGTAELAVAEDDTRAALSRLEEARRLAPNDRKVLLSLALVHRHAGDRAAAERYIELALDHHPEHPLVHLLAAEYYFAAGRLDRAAARTETTLSLRPENEDALMLAARIAYTRSDYENAAERAAEVLEVGRDNETAWYIRASALEHLERIDECIETLELGMRAVDDPEFLRLYAEQVLRRYRDADDELRADYAAHHFDRAERLTRENQVSRAFEAYRRGLRLAPYDRRGRVGFAELFRTRGYRAKYLQELEVLTGFMEEDRFLGDRIESYRSVLTESPAQEWDVRQFSLERSPMTVDLFVSAADSDLHHPDGAVVYGDYARDRMVSEERLSVPRSAEVADGFSQAYATARSSGSDYFLVLAVAEDDRSIAVEADLYLSRTGERLAELRAARTGNDRIERAVGEITRSVAGTVPLRGTLLEREGTRGLVTLGALDGLEPDEELQILRPRSMMLTTEEPGYRYADSDVVGTFRVERTDDLVSEGEISRKGFFDRIREGDVVVRAPAEDAPETVLESPEFPALYRELRRIR
ncbi:MAG: tetratricopeptide repeat protein [Spirochaetaceae bacterium]